jgi:hypothetical protein
VLPSYIGPWLSGDKHSSLLAIIDTEKSFITLTPRDNVIKLFSVFVFGEVFQSSSIFVSEAYLPLKCSRLFRDKHSSLFWPTVNDKEKRFMTLTPGRNYSFNVNVSPTAR